MHPLGNGIFPRILSVLYGWAVGVRNYLFSNLSFFSYNANRPVISVGGINAGGTGKTPLALLIGTYLAAQGNEVAFLSRGYHRKNRNTVISKPFSTAEWQDVGDEAALLHGNLPGSWLGIDASRINTIRKIQPLLSEKSVFVLDDGFQHRQLNRDIDILCVPADVFEDHLLPSGTLREPVNSMKRAQCIFVIGSADLNKRLAETKKEIISRYNPPFIAVLNQIPAGWVRAATGAVHTELPLKKPLLLCGIARPERFSNLAKSLAVIPAREVYYRDHHEFTEDEIKELCRGEFDGILTTEKDSCRLHTLNLVNCPDIWYLKIDLHFIEQNSKSVFFSYLSAAVSS